jgi:hypothetical protein
MGKKNNKSVPNNNLPITEFQATKIDENKQETDHEFSEELSDGGERNEIIKKQQNK